MSLGVSPRAHAVTALDGGVQLTLSGDFDLNARADLDAWLAQARSLLPNGGQITIAMAGVSFFDAGCTAVLARYSYGLSRIGIRIRLVGVQPSVRRVLTVLGLGDLVRS